MVIHRKQDATSRLTSGPDIGCRPPTISSNLQAHPATGGLCGMAIEARAFVLSQKPFDGLGIDWEVQRQLLSEFRSPVSDLGS